MEMGLIATPLVIIPKNPHELHLLLRAEVMGDQGKAGCVVRPSHM